MMIMLSHFSPDQRNITVLVVTLRRKKVIMQNQILVTVTSNLEQNFNDFPLESTSQRYSASRICVNFPPSVH